MPSNSIDFCFADLPYNLKKQQRLRSVLSFLRDEFAIDKAHSEDYGRAKFSELDQAVQDDISAYGLQRAVVQS